MSDTAVTSAFREEWGRVVSVLIHEFGNWDLAEECTQEAFAAAIASWPDSGVPARPGAWLLTVARRRALDRVRRERRYEHKLREVAVKEGDESIREDETPESPERGAIADERLRLIFTCCHPALAMPARVALTLRTLAGLSSAEIARAFLVPEETMAKRLVRAKHKIHGAGIPYRVPEERDLPERTDGVLTVLYLLFNEGYSATAGEDLVRRELCEQAIRLASVLVQLMPTDAEARGLLALMLFHRARQAARTDRAGDLVRLEDQDRSVWDTTLIEEGRRHLAAAARLGPTGPYQLQAAIAGCHALARTAEATDWARIAALYSELAEMTGSPVVELNRAVAVAMAEGPEDGLRLLDGLSGELDRYYLLHAARADLLRRSGRHRDAAESYREALRLVGTEPERRFLETRLAEMVGP